MEAQMEILVGIGIMAWTLVVVLAVSVIRGARG